MAAKGALAIPEEFVCTVMVLLVLLKRPEAPEAGAVKTTLAPETALPELSFTVTASGVKAVLIVTDCGVVPAFVVMEPGAPAVLVREKDVESEPVTAVTV